MAFKQWCLLHMLIIESYMAIKKYGGHNHF